MASDLNSVNIVGRLTKDCGADERSFAYLQSGMAVATVSIAVNRSRKQGDQLIDEVSYFDVKIYGKIAEGLKPYLVKGQQIAVNGMLKQERWTDKSGNKASRVVINALTVELIGGKHDSQPQSQYAQQYQQQQNGYQQNQPFTPQPQQQEMNYQGGDFPEDIPF